MTPVIGITCLINNHRTQDYKDAVTKFGGEPKPFAARDKNPEEHITSIPKYLEEIDGLLLAGGGAIDPICYRDETPHNFKTIDPSRDALDIQLCQKALETDIPVFGICRGIQVMCVVKGGFPHQSIRKERPEEEIRHKKKYEPNLTHDIKIEPHSRLCEIVKAEHATIISSHQQAVNEVGEGFVVSASTETKIIEAIEIPSRRFVIGVQYHPERMLKIPELCEHAAKLFQAFINAASQ